MRSRADRQRGSRRWLASAAISGLLFSCSSSSGPGSASRVGSGELLIDISARSGLEFVHFNGMSGGLYISEIMGPGAAFLDYDGDGDLDLYLPQGHMLGAAKTVEDALMPPVAPLPLRDRLYRNDLVLVAAGHLEPRLVDVTKESGLVATGYGMGVAVGDFDNDGDQDLYLTNHGPNQLWRNNGDGTFSDVTEETASDDPRWSVSAAFLDFDEDGWLDLIVVNYVDYQPGSARTCREPGGREDYCGPQAHPPEHDRLLRNRGDGTFTDVTLESGIFRSAGSGLGVTVGDFDGDGRSDIYVANDLMRNHLWLNRGDGTFSEQGLERGVALNIEGVAEASMGVDAADVDDDGDLDLFMTHLQGQSNTLYLNDGRGQFLDVSAGSRLAEPSVAYTAFGAAFVDFDADGDLDLLTVNGAVKSLDLLREAGDPFPLHQPNQLFLNDGSGRFEEQLPRPAVLAISEVSRGLAIGDVDNDGDADVLISNNAGPARLVGNTTDGNAGWVGVRLVGSHGGSSLPGSSVWLESGGRRRLRRARADGSYGSSRDPRVLFGRGRDSGDAALELRWAEGGRTRWTRLPGDRYLVLPYD